MAAVLHTPKDWGITVDDYNSAVFGRALAKFQVPPSIAKRFRKNITTQVIDANGNVSNQPSTVFDSDRFLEEIATTYIQAVVAMYQILRETEFNKFEEDTRYALKMSVYNAIEYALLNRQIWQNVNGSQITVPGWTVNADQTPWVLTSDMIGLKAHNWLTNSGVEDYEWRYDDVISIATSAGNTKIIEIIQLDEDEM